MCQACATPLDSETGCTGDFWSKNNLNKKKLENILVFKDVVVMFEKKKKCDFFCIFTLGHFPDVWVFLEFNLVKINIEIFFYYFFNYLFKDKFWDF